MGPWSNLCELLEASRFLALTLMVYFATPLSPCRKSFGSCVVHVHVTVCQWASDEAAWCLGGYCMPHKTDIARLWVWDQAITLQASHHLPYHLSSVKWPRLVSLTTWSPCYALKAILILTASHSCHAVQHTCLRGVAPSCNLNMFQIYSAILQEQEMVKAEASFLEGRSAWEYFLDNVYEST